MSLTLTQPLQVNNPALSLSGVAKPKAAVATAPTTTTSATSNSASQTSLNALGSTFLKLLTQELQNQDPTAPVDSTQMVGQMISLNQLDQTASINQLLTTVFGSSSAAGTGSATGTGSSQNAASAQQVAAAAQTNTAAAVQAALAGLNSGAAAAAGLSSTGFPNF